MLRTSRVNQVSLPDLINLLARRLGLDIRTIVPYAEFTDFLTDILKMSYKPSSKFLSASHVSPEVEIAADRAEVEMAEILGESPFTTSVEEVLKEVRSPHDTIYVANPNRVNSTNFSLAGLKKLAAAVPDGLLLIDEYYHDYYGISGQSLLETYANVIVLRSFTGSFGIKSADAGFAITSLDLAEQIKQSMSPHKISSTIRKTILASLMNQEVLLNHMQDMHSESLRICTGLGKLGVQCRLTSADFLLMRVADTTRVGNYLARLNIPIDNLDGYTMMKNYMRYRIQSYLSNEKLLDAFKRMPGENFKMDTVDRRAVRIRKSGEKEVPLSSSRDRLSGQVESERLQTDKTDEKTEAVLVSSGEE